VRRGLITGSLSESLQRKALRGKHFCAAFFVLARMVRALIASDNRMP